MAENKCWISSRIMCRLIWAVAASCALALGPLALGADEKPASAAQVRAALAVYDSPYYTIHTDLDADDVNEAIIRMTRMFEEYHQRTSAFSGEIRTKLPFYLFKNAGEYHAAGGPPETGGVFTGNALLAIAGDHANTRTWHVVQHEGFHQFAAAVIGGDIPVWVNEGLAEYFGEAVFTGDSFYTGGIPAMRLRRLKGEISPRDGAHSALLSVPELMMMSHTAWNAKISGLNYDQAWSMVYFLAHGEDGKYQKPFNAFMIGLSNRKTWEKSWKDTFGDANGFEEHWRKYWIDAPPDPTDALYARATVATLTSFLGRCAAQKQTFASFEEFSNAAETGSLKITRADWLPGSLISSALATVHLREKDGARYVLTHHDVITCTLPDGTRQVGSFTLRNGIVQNVKVVDLPPLPTLAPAATSTTHPAPVTRKAAPGRTGDSSIR